MAILRRSAWLLAAAGAAGCDLQRDPTPLGPLETMVSVHAVIRAGSDTVRVLIAKGVDGAEPIGNPRPVSGATVRLSGPAGEIVLEEAVPALGPCRGYSVGGPLEAAGPGCYAGLLPGPAAPGQAFDVSIRLPDGGEVQGANVLPEPVAVEGGPAGGSITVPDAGEAAGPPASATFAWSRELAGALTYFYFRVDTAFEGGQAVLETGCYTIHELSPTESRASSGSVELTIRSLVCVPVHTEGGEIRPVDWDSVHARLWVAAYDSALTRYQVDVLDGGSVALGRASAGITGAAGVFGGITLTARPLVLVHGRD